VQVGQPFGSDIVFVGVRRFRSRAIQAAVKRLLDVVLSLAFLIVLAPLLLLAGLVIRMDGGPALFAQTRMGRGGRSFLVLKYRTMHVDAEDKLKYILAADARAREEWQKHQKLAVDPRITAIGRFLRATSLDELPQLINVLKGDMSLVGPRPIVAGNHCNHAGDAAYARSEDFRAYYTPFRPGITGMWQVSGRNSTDYSERVRLDRWYARNWSLWLDVVILFKTLSALVYRTGC
jgi:undecaprenyl-phosphate galactose phosphotransferase